MHLKKGDVVAIVATVVEEESAKVKVSINGAEIDEGLIVPIGVLRLLERSASHGDKVILPDGRKGTYFQALNDNVAIVLLDDADERDPSAYVNVLRENLRNQNQEGVVQFAPIKKSVAGAETGRDIIDATTVEEASADNVEQVEEELGHDEEQGHHEPVVEDDENLQANESAENGIKVDEPVIALEFPIKIGRTTQAEPEAEEPHEAAEAADEITVEMPDSPLPRRSATPAIDEVAEDASLKNEEEGNIDDASPEGEGAISVEEAMPTPSEEDATEESITSDEEDASEEAEDTQSNEEPLAAEDTHAPETKTDAESEPVIDANTEEEDNQPEEAPAPAEEDPKQAEAVENNPAEKPEPIRDPERTAHLESMKKDMLAGIREQEGQTEEPAEDGDDIFSSIDSLDKRM